MVHYYANRNAHYYWTEPHSKGTESVTARTVTKLYTGGKAVAGRKSLLRINAGATEYFDPPGDIGQIEGFAAPWWATPSAPVANARLTVGSKSVGADGNLWLALPDDAEQDLTVSAKDAHHYAAWATATKYSPYINLTTATTNANLSTNVPEVCVGQQVNFTLNWNPNLPSGVVIGGDTLQHWTLPEKFVNQQTNYSATCTNDYVRNYDLLINTNLVRCWFVNGNGGTVITGQNLHFTNGQYASIAAVGSFAVYRPSVRFSPHSDEAVILDAETNDIYLGIGWKTPSHPNAMRFDMTVSVNPNFPGWIRGLQIISRNTLYDIPQMYLPPANIPDDTGGQFWLDNGIPFEGWHEWRVGVGSSLIYINYMDDPNTEGNIASFIEMSDYLLYYLTFQPDGGIPVTIYFIEWNWDGNASATNGSWQLTDHHLLGPYDIDADDFPEWSNVYKNE
jgi:hypothetical protein